MRRQTGTGWNQNKGVIVMDTEWWRKAKEVRMVSFYLYLLNCLWTINLLINVLMVKIE
jgi:hypothetical protein